MMLVSAKILNEWQEKTWAINWHENVVEIGQNVTNCGLEKTCLTVITT